jgi:hypothetical protein
LADNYYLAGWRITENGVTREYTESVIPGTYTGTETVVWLNGAICDWISVSDTVLGGVILYYPSDAEITVEPIISYTSGPANTAPALKTGVPSTATASVNIGSAYTLDLSAIFEDADDDPLTYKVSINSTPAVSANKNYSYAPVSSGTYTLVFRANDGKADSPAYTVTLAANTAPALKTGVPSTATASVNTGTAYTLDLSAVFEDADDDLLTYKVSINSAPAVSANKNYSYVPASSGTYTLVFTANDGKADSPAYTVTLAANTAPALKTGVPSTATASVNTGTAYTLDLSAVFEDADDDLLTYKVSINSAPAVSANKNYSYVPASSGTYTLVFTANDGKADSPAYTVTLTSEGDTVTTATFKYTGEYSETANVIFEPLDPVGWYFDSTTASQAGSEVTVSGDVINNRDCIGAGLKSLADNYYLAGWKITENGVTREYTESLIPDTYNFTETVVWLNGAICNWIAGSDSVLGGVILNYPSNAEIIIEPIISYTSQTFTLTVKSEDITKGVVNFNPPINNKYTLIATPANGYVFDHWAYRTAGSSEVYTPDLDSYGKATYTVTLSEDREYIAYFNVSQVSLAGDTMGIYKAMDRLYYKLAQNQYGSGSAASDPHRHMFEVLDIHYYKEQLLPKNYAYSNVSELNPSYFDNRYPVATTYNSPWIAIASESVDAYDNVILWFRLEYPNISAVNGSFNVRVFAGEGTSSNPIGTAEWTDITRHNQDSSGRGVVYVPVDFMPYTDKVTVELTIGEDAPLVRTYPLAEAMNDTELLAERGEAASALREAYDEHMAEVLSRHNVYSSEYLMLNEEYAGSLEEVKDATTVAEITAAKEKGLAYMADAANSIFHSGVRVKVYGVWVTVPEEVNVATVMCAALEEEWPGQWYMYVSIGSGFGWWVNWAGLGDGLDEVSGAVLPGNGSPVYGPQRGSLMYGIGDGGFYFANGVSLQKIWDGLTINIGGWRGPEFNSIAWDLAKLRMSHSDEYLSDFEAFNNAVAHQNDVKDSETYKAAHKALRLEFLDVLYGNQTEAMRSTVRLIAAIDLGGSTAQDQITAARAAYNALPFGEKANVFNYTDLVYAELASLSGDALAAAQIDVLIDTIGTVTYSEDSLAKIDAAFTAYELVGQEVKALVKKIETLNIAKTTYAGLANESVSNVKNLINALPSADSLTYPHHEAAVNAAKAAYNALLTAEKTAFDSVLYNKLQNSITEINNLKNEYLNSIKPDQALEDVLEYIETTAVTNPKPGSISGEWAVLSLARGNLIDEDDAWAQKYLENLDADLALADSTPGKAITKKTDYQRVTLALTALGIDAANYNGQNLTTPYLACSENMLLNAKIFGLIALNSKPYTSTAIDDYIDEIIGEQCEEGGWNNLEGMGPADPDMTAMALQALAPYYDTRQDVTDAVDAALTALKEMQDESTGSFIGSYEGGSRTCSTAQVVTALCSLDIDPTGEDWIKGGKNPLTALLSCYNDDYGYFGDNALQNEPDQMATEQAAYSLVAYDRLISGQKSLYDMRDALASSDNRVASVKVSNVTATASGNTFNVELPRGTNLAELTKNNISITLKHAKASVITEPETADNGVTWTFTVKAENGATAIYTIHVSLAADQGADNEDAVAAAKAIVEGLSWSVDMDTANDETGIESWAEDILDGLDLDGVDATVTVNTFTAATAGDAVNKSGKNGEFALTVSLVKGEGDFEARDSVEVTDGGITATRYFSDDTRVKYVKIGDAPGQINGTTITVVLDYTEDAVLPTSSSAISITTYDADADASEPNTLDEGATWTFTVTAEKGNTTDYTIHVSLAADPAGGAKAAVEAAKSAIENDTYTTVVNTEDGVLEWLEQRITANPGTQGVTVWVEVITFTPAEDGTAKLISGKDGGFTFDAALEKGYNGGTVTDSVYGVEGDIIAIPYILSSDNSVKAITVNSTQATSVSTYEYKAVLPYTDDAVLPTQADAVQITLNHGKAEVISLATTDNGKTWIFTVKAENGTTATYKLYVSIGANMAAIDAAIHTITNSDWIINMSLANTTQTVRAWVQTRIAQLDLGVVQADLAMGSVTPAIVGTAANTSGTDGSFTFTLNLHTGQGATQATGSVPVTGVINATTYTSPIETPGNNVTVTFRLIGATLSNGSINLGDGDWKESQYVNWIKTRSYTLPSGSTVYDLFVEALDYAGLDNVGADSNYVETIYAPKVLGNYELSEFTNGKYSGWMYTVNGIHPGTGLKNRTLKNNDKVIWHYVNDYRYEVADWFDGDPKYPKLGNGEYYNKWLAVADTNPLADSVKPTGTNPPATSNTTLPKVTATDGVAAVTINQTDMGTLIAGVKKDNTSALVIKPEITGEVQKINVELPKISISSLVSETDAALKVETPVGIITISQDALAAIASQASGSTVTMSLETVNKSTLTPEQQKVVGDNLVYDISVVSGGKNISGFDGGSLTISLPYTLKDGQDPDNVMVWYLNDKGELEKMSCTYDKTTGLATFTTTHLSKYLVGYAEAEAWKSPFADIKTGNWFYEDVKFAVNNGLFKGTTETAFGPNQPMTRAMLVTVLYRLEGSPSALDTNNFTDVKDGEWYTKAVLWANANNIVSGYGNGLSGTNDPVTREQMASILYRYASYKGYDVTAAANLTVYTDVADISSWAQTAMSWANARGLITGRTTTNLVSGGTATRAEVAAILKRFVESFVK